MPRSMRNISPKDAVIEFGALVFQNDFTVVRAKSVRNAQGNWRTQVVVHRKKNGIEQLPLGYVRGENMLWLNE